MSRQAPSATKGLAISITSAPQPSYKPGDTISGRVFRQVPVLVGPESVTVTIRLVGQSTAKITQWSDHTGESQSSCTSRFNLFAPGDTLQTLHCGPLHIERTASGLAHHELGPRAYEEGVGRSWSFSVTIPSRTSAGPREDLESDGRRDGESFRRHSFVAVDEDGHVSSQPLPSSVYVERCECDPGTFLHGHVEYFLEARLVSANSNNAPVAVAPITIHNRSMRTENAADQEMRVFAFTELFGKSFWKARAELRFEVGTPSSHTLDQRNPLPFTIRAMRASPRGSGDKRPRRPDGDIRVKALSVAVRATSTAWAPKHSALGPWRQVTEASYYRSFELFGTESEGQQLLEGAIVPFALEAERLDLGQLLDIQFQPGLADSGSRAGAVQDMQQLKDFQTVNVKRSHKIVWQVVLEVEGEQVALGSEADIVLL